ncbi:MAG: DUF5615 family PIN-like protein [Hormoscilla sp.]
MAYFYTDENFPLPVVEFLRSLGHDVLTAKAAGNANLGIPDEEVLAFAVSQNLAVLTRNRRHFIRLHRLDPNHAGIVVCTEDPNFERLATRINEAISIESTLRGQLIRINRPQQ